MSLSNPVDRLIAKRSKARSSTARSRTAVFFLIIIAAFVPRQTTIAETLQKQVLIEPKFVEVSDKNLRDLGWNPRLGEKLAKLPPEASELSSQNATHFGLGPTPSQTTINTHLFPGPGSDPNQIQLTGLITDAQLQVILNTLGQQKDAKIISAPELRIHSNEPVNIQIPSVSFQGVKLEVVPRINPEGRLEMTLTPIQSTELSKETGVNTPVIQDIPVLGGLFRDKGGGKEDLLIFVKARVVDVLEPSSGDGSSNAIKVETIGTGETIGHIADLKISNLTDQPSDFIIPPIVLESKSSANQDYACPHEENVSLSAHETKIVPIDGVCVNRDKPPVGKGVTGDLVMNTADPGLPQNRDSHIPANQARDLLRICTAKYEAADKLQKDGALKDLPYKDKHKQKDIMVQWSTWTDPRISEITGSVPATKDDLKKVVYKQVSLPMKPEDKKKIDKGIDTIFDKIELTTAKAKDLEQQETSAQADKPPGSFEISNQTTGESGESPAPKTQEKPKKDKKNKKDKGPPGEWAQPIVDWWLKVVDADKADYKKERAQDDYKKQLDDFFKKSKRHQELEEAINKKQGGIDYWGTSEEARDKLVKERNELKKELTKLEGELEKDFQKTDDGKKALAAKGDAEKAAADAHKAAKEAGNYIDQEALGEKLEELLKAAAEKAKEKGGGPGTVQE